MLYLGCKMNIEALIKEIVPPATHAYRNGFSNETIIAKLTAQERPLVEERLLQMLEKSYDNLIAEALIYLKSTAALPILYKWLDKSWWASTRLEIAAYIFTLNKDLAMIYRAVTEFEKIEKSLIFKNYALIDAFYHLKVFNDELTKDCIRQYVDHKDFLVAYNAKRCLGISE